jgi:hypothetical protein
MTTLLAHVALWFAAGYALMSVIEWWLHRHHMHRRGFLNAVQPWLFRNHQVVHHPAYRHDFTQSDPPGEARVGVYMPMVKSGLLGLLLAVPFGCLVSPTGAATLWLGLLLHHVAWNVLHGEMHGLARRRLKRFALYRWLHRNHWLHHRHPNRHFNIVCIGFDHLAGTYVAATDVERAEWEKALNGD